MLKYFPKFIPYSIVLGTVRLLFILLKIFFYINTGISGFYIFVISRLSPSSTHKFDMEIPEGSNSESIFRENFTCMFDNLLDSDLEIFKINREFGTIYVLINDTNDLLRFFKKIKKDRTIWISFLTRYGEITSRASNIPLYLVSTVLSITNEINFYRRYISDKNRIVFDGILGCKLGFWLNSEIHYKGTEEYNRSVYKIASKDWIIQKGLLIKKNDMEKLRITPYKSEFPIDIVYTWVDDADPEWQKSYNREIKDYGNKNILATSALLSRFRNYNELKYSIRSLCMYANFFRKIFIVTAGQIPDWLDTKNERVQIVNHKNIFEDNNDLPTFNSHSIESRLHHIEGLSENYLYFNDDVFIGRPLTPGNFFLNSRVSYYFNSDATYIGLNPANILDLPVDVAAKNNRDLIYNNFEYIVTRKFIHAPHAQLKSVLFEIEKIFKSNLNNTSNNKFRDISDLSLPSSLYHHYAKLTERAAPGEINLSYFDLSDRNLNSLLNNLKGLKTSGRPDVICINDIDFNPQDNSDIAVSLEQFFEYYFPVKSEFEI